MVPEIDVLWAAKRWLAIGQRHGGGRGLDASILMPNIACSLDAGGAGGRDGTRCRDRLCQGKMRPGNFVFDSRDPPISNLLLRQNQHEGVTLSRSMYSAALVLNDIPIIIDEPTAELK